MLKNFIKDLALGLVPIAQYPACLSLNNVMTGEHLVEDEECFHFKAYQRHSY